MDTHAYCPSCRQESAIDSEGNCLWCGDRTQPGRKKAGRPLGKYSRLSDEQLRGLYHLHLDGLSIRELGRRIRDEAGFRSDKSAAMAISSGFKRLALNARSQSEATALANEERGDPEAPPRSDAAVYKRWLRKKNGALRPCQGVKLTYPEKGRPCRRYASPGSDFCLAHDPMRRADVLDRAARAREGSGRKKDSHRGRKAGAAQSMELTFNGMERVLITRTDHPNYNQTGTVLSYRLLDQEDRYVAETEVRIDGQEDTTVVKTGEYKLIR